MHRTTDDVLQAIAGFADGDSVAPERHGDARDGQVYVLTPEVVTAIKVAVATGRPLLLSGPPGCGKSSLASYIARNLRLSYYDFTVNEQSEPQDLLWTVDLVRRLNEAQAKTVEADLAMHNFVEPGALWWSLSPETAALRGAPPGTTPRPAVSPSQHRGYEPEGNGAVLLIDEIDKTDGGFANGLLVPLGSRRFFLHPIGRLIDGSAAEFPGSPIVVITTNNERSLPDAFVRRCVALRIPSPTPEHLMRAADAHFGEALDDFRQQVGALAERVTSDAHLERAGTTASTGEFLDLVQVLLSLRLGTDSDEWRTVEQLVIEKQDVRNTASSEW